MKRNKYWSKYSKHNENIKKRGKNIKKEKRNDKFTLIWCRFGLSSKMQTI